MFGIARHGCECPRRRVEEREKIECFHRKNGMIALSKIHRYYCTSSSQRGESGFAHSLLLSHLIVNNGEWLVEGSFLSKVRRDAECIRAQSKLGSSGVKATTALSRRASRPVYLDSANDLTVAVRTCKSTRLGNAGRSSLNHTHRGNMSARDKDSPKSQSAYSVSIFLPTVEAETPNCPFSPN